jgi:hypothetical protein
VTAALWLYALAPVQSTALIVAYAFLVWKLRRSISLRRL